MVSSAQNLANLNTAAQLTAINLSLDLTPASDWTQDQRIGFIHALATQILSYPNDFLPSTIASASAILGSNLASMQLSDYVTESPDGSAALQKTFVDELGDKILGAGQSIGNLGNGVLNLISRSGAIVSNLGAAGEQASATAAYGWVMPVAIVGLVFVAIAAGARETRRAFTG